VETVVYVIPLDVVSGCISGGVVQIQNLDIQVGEIKIL